MDFFLNIISLSMVVASMVVSVYLFVTLKREMYGSETRREEAEAKLTLELEAFKIRTQELERDLAQASLSGSPAITAGMNLTKRSQALRRTRQGEGLEQIAAALALPLKEVELLVKVSNIVEEQSSGSTS